MEIICHIILPYWKIKTNIKTIRKIKSDGWKFVSLSIDKKFEITYSFSKII